MSKQYLYKVGVLSKIEHHPLEASAYFSGETQYDVLNNKEYISNTSNKVLWSNIIIPSKTDNFDSFSHLPEYLKFRSTKKDLISNSRNTLWKEVQNRENRPDSQFARVFQLSIPHFLSKDESVDLINQFSQLLIDEGMIVDAALHDNNLKQPSYSIFEQLQIIDKDKKNTNKIDKKQDFTCFLMCTLRDYKNNQFVNKNRDWNSTLKLTDWRSKWVKLLDSAINNSLVEDEAVRESWKHKLNIYPEYKKLNKHKP